MPGQIPMVDYLVLDDPPYLRAYECNQCGALYFDRRNACAQCSQDRCSDDRFSRRPLAREGTIRSFTIVHRASSSIPVPYTSVVVDLDAGGTVKANLVDHTTPDGITAQARVRMVTFVAGRDDDGTDAVAFGFRLTEAAI